MWNGVEAEFYPIELRGKTTNCGKIHERHLIDCVIRRKKVDEKMYTTFSRPINIKFFTCKKQINRMKAHQMEQFNERPIRCKSLQ